MNKDRRNWIARIARQLEELRSQIDTLADEEREAFDNMPEGLQGSPRGEAAEAAADALENVGSLIGDALEALEEAAA